MSIDSYWRRLLTELRSVGSVREESGRLVVSHDRPDGGARDIVIVLTPDQWDDMASVAWGDVDAAASWVGQAVRDVGPEHRYLVYEAYDLVPSDEPERHPDPDWQALEAYLEEDPEDRGKGAWYA